MTEENQLPDSEPEFAEKVGDIAEEFVDEVEGAIESVLPPHLRLRVWMKRRPVTHAIWRASVLVLGIVLVLAGILMLIFPGPGWVTIFLGLAVLSSEFAWAHRFYSPLQKAFEWGKRKAKERAQRKANR